MLTRPRIFSVHIDHPLLLVLIAELAFLLAFPVEGWSCAAARLCTLPVFHVHHPLLRSTNTLCCHSAAPLKILE